MKSLRRLFKWFASEAPAGNTAPNYAAEEAALKVVRDQIEAGQAVYLDQSDMPTDEDFALIGKIIQAYCYADINARRIINAIRHAAIGPDARNAGGLPDSEIYKKLREAADMLPPKQCPRWIAQSHRQHHPANCTPAYLRALGRASSS